MSQVEVEVTMERIKACPFCGEEKWVRMNAFGSGSDTYCFCSCICGGMGPTSNKKGDAVLLWNAAANQIEKLKRERDEARRWARKLYRTLNEIRETYFKEW